MLGTPNVLKRKAIRQSAYAFWKVRKVLIRAITVRYLFIIIAGGSGYDRLGNTLTRAVSCNQLNAPIENSIDQILVETIDVFLRYGTRKDYSFVPPNSGDTSITKEEITHG
jgi:hypothetical protein